jgi:sec-independent protein translocase protein TatA
MPTLGFGELLIVFAIIVLVFGASRIPKLAGGLGSGIRNFKRGLNEPGEDEAEDKQKREIEE